MWHGMVVLVTAAAVLTHAVAGCCAHYRHGGHTCGERLASASQVSRGDDPLLDGCRRVCSRDQHPSRCGGDHAGSQPPAPVPGDGSGPCSSASCVYAAPSSPESSPRYQPSWTGLVIGDLASALSGECADGRAGWMCFRFTPPPLGGLRVHLALGVLTL